MTATPHRPSRSRSRPLGASGAACFVRWLLVLVLAFDHLSAPFHAHSHDGAAGQLEFGAAHAALDDGDTHVEGDDPTRDSHSAMALRITPSQLGQLPAPDGADAPVALLSQGGLLDSFDDALTVRWRPDRSHSDFQSQRSLPPASRAPPPHA